MVRADLTVSRWGSGMSSAIELTNLHPDPNCYKQRGPWEL